ncbi:MAG: methionyl-tRNA formyltransferase [Erysipelotrichaceae bacterium]
MKRIVFMGTSSFAAEILKYLIENNYQIIAVITQPDRLVGRKKQLKFSAVKELALKYALTIIQPFNIKEDYFEVVNLQADLYLTCAYGQFLPQEIIDLNVVNIHASLLPKYRGGAPMHRAIINGDSETGITLMKSSIKMDAGDIIASKSVSIDINDTTSILEKKLIKASLELLDSYLDNILIGKITYTKQNENEKTIAKIISSSDEYIDLNRDYNTVYNHIRGLIDWPVGYSFLKGKKFKFHKVEISDKISRVPNGTIIGFDNEAMLIAIDSKILRVLELQIEGKTKISAKDFKNGAGKNLIGEKFDE